MRKAVSFIRSVSGLYYHAVGVFAFVFLPFISFKTTQDPELMPRMALISFFVSVVVLTFILRLRQFEFTKSSVHVFGLIILMLGWTGLSMIQSINTGDAFTEWIRLSVHFIFFFCMYVLFSNRLKDHVYLLVRYSMIAVYIFSIIGVFQMVIGWEKHNEIAYSLANTVWSTLSNKNFFSECLVLFLPFLVIGFLSERSYWRMLFLISILTDLAFILILQSTGAWMALFAGFVFGIPAILKGGLRFRRVIPIAVIIAACCFAVFVVNLNDKSILSSKIKNAKEYLFHPELINKTRVENNNSVFERLMLWRNTLKMIADHPVAGVGLNNWKIINPSYGIGGTQFTNTGMISYEHPHNDYLLLLAEQGPAGLIIYLLFIFFIVRSGIIIFRKTDERERRYIALLISGVIAFSVISLVSYPRYRSYQMMLLMIISALILSFSDEPKMKFLKVKPIAFLLLILTVSGTVVFASRVLSEIQTMKAIRAQLDGNFPRMYREAGKADTWLSPLDISSTPLGWYKGMAKFYLHDIPGAAVEYEKALLVNPNHLRVLNDLATSYEQSGKRPEAIYYYRKGLEISPYFIEGNLNLSAAYYNSGNIDSAYYFINRIKDYPMSMREEGNYKIFMKAILERKKS